MIVDSAFTQLPQSPTSGWARDRPRAERFQTRFLASWCWLRTIGLADRLRVKTTSLSELHASEACCYSLPLSFLPLLRCFACFFHLPQIRFRRKHFGSPIPVRSNWSTQTSTCWWKVSRFAQSITASRLYKKFG